MSPTADRVAESALEILLFRASTEPGLRPAFYRALLDSVVLAIAARTGSSPAEVRAGETLDLLTWPRDDGVIVLPFFTSASAVYEAAPGGATCVQLTGRELFEMTRGCTLHLNPASVHGREFLPSEVDALLMHGSIQTVPPVVTPEGVQVTIGRPEAPPQQMLASLIALYARLATVRVAHLAEVHGMEPGTGSLVIGLGIDSDDPEPVVRDTAAVVADTYAGPQTVDVYCIEDSDEGLSAYFRTAASPFYDRAWGSRLVANHPEQRDPS